MPAQNTPDTPNPDCRVCNGSGIDDAFGATCTECWVDVNREAAVAARYQGVQTYRSDRAYTPGERMDGRTFGGSTGSDVASDRQLAYIESLARQVDDALISDALRRAMDANTITKRSASKIIDALKGLQATQRPTEYRPANADHDTVPRQARPEQARSNRYASRCADCGTTVDAGAGFLRRNAQGRWDAYHGECPTRPTEQAPAPTEVATIPEGHYAIPSTGDNDLAFYRVDHNDRWGVSVKQVIGGHPDQWVRRNAVPGIVARIVEYGVEEARTLYGTQIGRCWKCNRHLTDEVSRAAGIGPDCATRV